MHISYFLDFTSIQGFKKSLMALPGLNTQGVTSKSLKKVPWGNQYRIGGSYYCIEEEYSLYDEEYSLSQEEEDEDEYTVVEHLSHKGWVQI